MKKVVSLFAFACVALTISANSAFSQNQRADSGQVNGRSQTFYVEALGSGLIVSANYDTRFKSGDPGGLGGRVGIGYFSSTDVSLVSIPVQLNYLLGGKGGNYFEVGGGMTYATGKVSFSDDTEGEGGDVAGTLVFGYRKQPVGGGFNFRAGLTPIFGKGYFMPYWPHLSLGYTF